MRFSQEKLGENVPEGLPAWAFLEQFGGAEFDRASLCTQAAQRLAPVLERFAPAPEGGWLSAAYAALLDGLFPDPEYLPPPQPVQQGIALLISVLEALLACEEAAFDPLTDLLPFDEGLPTRVGEEYARFNEEIKASHFLLTLRMSRELMPFDADAKKGSRVSAADKDGKKARKLKASGKII